MLEADTRSVFKKDGAALPFAFMRQANDGWEMFGTLADGKRTKYMIYRNLWTLAFLNDYDAVIHTGEMWQAPTPATPTPYFRTEEHTNVKELLATIYESRDGQRGAITSQIFRVGPAVFLGKRSEELDAS